MEIFIIAFILWAVFHFTKKRLCQNEIIEDLKSTNEKLSNRVETYRQAIDQYRAQIWHKQNENQINQFSKSELAKLRNICHPDKNSGSTHDLWIKINKIYSDMK